MPGTHHTFEIAGQRGFQLQESPSAPLYRRRRSEEFILEIEEFFVKGFGTHLNTGSRLVGLT
jgi:hypothetical protein